LEEIREILSNHSFFKDLTPDQLTSIAEHSRRLNFSTGDFLMREDEPGNCFFMILYGQVAVEVFSPERGPIIVSTLGEGDILGYCWLIPPYQCRFDVRATELTRTICVDGVELRKICEENHEIGYELLKRTSQMMSKLLEATRVQVLDVYGDH
jgi:CRP/FNR family cyclic AMP-dependent transcriptional regulator